MCVCVFAWAVFQLWTRAVEEFHDVGVPLCYGSGCALLFKKGGDGLATQRDSQFADDSALFASTHGGACHALTTCMAIASSFGLKVNLGKTKFMAVGVDVSLEDHCPLHVCGGKIEHVSKFQYFGSIISTDGRCHRYIKSRISSASRAMGALRRPVFADSNLSLHVKRIVFEACVVALLLYGSECGVPVRRDVVAPSVFYNTSIRGIMGISQRDVWEQHLSMSTIFQA